MQSSESRHLESRKPIFPDKGKCEFQARSPSRKTLDDIMTHRNGDFRNFKTPEESGQPEERPPVDALRFGGTGAEYGVQM